MKKMLIMLTILFSAALTQAQILHPVKWSYAAKKVNATEAVVFFKATIEDGWHIYSQNVAEGGPIKTSITFTPSKAYTTVGKTIEPKPVSKFEKAFNMQVSYFEHEVVFQQKIKLKSKTAVSVKGVLEFMTCNDKQCLPPEDIEYAISVK